MQGMTAPCERLQTKRKELRFQIRVLYKSGSVRSAPSKSLLHTLQLIGNEEVESSILSGSTI